MVVVNFLFFIFRYSEMFPPFTILMARFFNLISFVEFTFMDGLDWITHLQLVRGLTLLKKAKLAREISDGKNEIPHKFLGRKI